MFCKACRTQSQERDIGYVECWWEGYGLDRINGTQGAIGGGVLPVLAL